MKLRLHSSCVIGVFALACSLLEACAPAPVAAVQGRVDPLPKPAAAVIGLTLTVSELERSERLLEALNFSIEKRARLAGPALGELFDLPDPVVDTCELRLGNETVELRRFESPGGRAIPADARSNDLSFQHMAIVVSDMDAAYQRVRRLGIHPVSSGPQTLPRSNPTAAGIRAFYFRDSDGHALELIQFPPGKGAKRWQAPGPDVFLGIDHTAIVVLDTDRSAPLYEALGFGVAGRSLNFGVEQARLSGVPGARVRITGFAAGSGPGVEFLSYLEPITQKANIDTRVNDLGHWEVSVRVPDVEGALGRVLQQGGSRLSASVVDVGGLDLGYAKAVVVRDRDGHSLKLVGS